MTEEQPLAPKLRFQGFTDAWELRKLGDAAGSFTYGLNASAKPFDGENKYLRITDIDDSSREFSTDSLTSPDYDLASATNYKLRNGDILFARTGASVGKSYRYRQPDGKVYFAGYLIRAQVLPEFDTEFVYQNTLTRKYDDFIKITSQRSGQPGVNAQEYATFPLNAPSLAEQQQLGKLFETLDEIIALQKRKLLSLEKLQGILLNQMFPNGAEEQPRLRFAGYCEPWKSTQLGNLLVERNELAEE